MAQITPYLRFDNNCAEALTFYQSCIGGELSLQKVSESGAAEHMPAESQDLVMHGSLSSDSFMIFGSDMGPKEGITAGTAIVTCLHGETEEIKEMYEKLSAGGTIVDPLADTFFGAFGSFTDKYGMPWMVQSQPDVAL